MKFIQRALVIAALLLCARASYAQTYQVVGSQTSTVAGDLTKTVTTVQVGTNPLDRFLISRVRKTGQGQPHRGTLLLLPPLGAASRTTRRSPRATTTASRSRASSRAAASTCGATRSACRG